LAVALSVKSLKKYFPIKTGLFRTLSSTSSEYVRAVDGVDFGIEQGEVLGLVGESGCGKTTIARLIMNLIPPTSGTIEFEGRSVNIIAKKDLQVMRQRIQMIFQDPYGTLDPRMSIFDLIAEPLDVHKLVSNRNEREKRVIHALAMVGLEPAESFAHKFPHELSGGERQRAAIARSLVLEPKFIVADEPVSMLDVSVRVGILNLLRNLISRQTIAMLFITHDLAVARYVSDRIAIMYLGKIAEIGNADEVIEKPLHPYTRALVSAVPSISSKLIQMTASLPNEETDESRIPPGCSFHPRCPYAEGICSSVEPVLREFPPSRRAACHLLEKIT
jgi:oligopeptide/dipeptide ABC transporter ATP-binding protein